MKQFFKQLYKNLRFRLSSNNCFLFIWFYRYLYKPEEGTLARMLSEYSSKNRGDFKVIQVGANDGITHDPIHKFIKRDNWSGILLEPQKHLYPHLSRLYRKNKGITILNAAIGHEDGTITLYKIGFTDTRWATGLATFKKEVLQEAFDSGYVHRNAEKDNIPVPDDPDQQIIAEEIDVISPATLIKKYNIIHLDLLQIDTEGFDYEVIKMFLGAGITPGMIIFENSHLTENEMDECEKLLKSKGFELTKFGRNSTAVAPAISLRDNS